MLSIPFTTIQVYMNGAGILIEVLTLASGLHLHHVTKVVHFKMLQLVQKVGVDISGHYY